MLILNIYLVDVLFNKKDPQTQDRGTLVFASGPLANGSVRVALTARSLNGSIPFPANQCLENDEHVLLGQVWPIFTDDVLVSGSVDMVVITQFWP